MTNTKIAAKTEVDAFIINSNSTEDINENDVRYAIEELQKQNKDKTYKEFLYKLLVPYGKGNVASRIAESFRNQGYPITRVEEKTESNNLEWFLVMIMSR